MSDAALDLMHGLVSKRPPVGYCGNNFQRVDAEAVLAGQRPTTLSRGREATRRPATWAA